MNTLYLNTKQDAIDFAKEINEAFWTHGKSAAADVAFSFLFRNFKSQEVFDAFESEIETSVPEIKRIFLQLVRDYEFFDPTLYE